MVRTCRKNVSQTLVDPKEYSIGNQQKEDRGEEREEGEN